MTVVACVDIGLEGIIDTSLLPSRRLKWAWRFKLSTYKFTQNVNAGVQGTFESSEWARGNRKLNLCGKISEADDKF